MSGFLRRALGALGNGLKPSLREFLRARAHFHAALPAGHRPGNLVDTAAMTKEARQELREALKAVRSFSRASFAGFTGEIW